MSKQYMIKVYVTDAGGGVISQNYTMAGRLIIAMAIKRRRAYALRAGGLAIVWGQNHYCPTLSRIGDRVLSTARAIRAVKAIIAD